MKSGTANHRTDPFGFGNSSLQPLSIWAIFLPASILLLALLSSGCKSAPSPALCAGITCSGQGQCLVQSGQAACDCNRGYHAEGLKCLKDAPDPCTPNPCSESHRGRCGPAGDGGIQCDCDNGYQLVREACQPNCEAQSALCTAAHASFGTLVSSNGHGAIGYNLAERKADTLLEHLYRNWDEGSWTRDLLYDTFLGLRSPASSQWLNEITPIREEYLKQTGIINLLHRIEKLKVDTYIYAPWQLSRPALVLIGKVTNDGPATETISLYTLHNYHLGYTSAQDPVNPDSRSERLRYLSQTGAYLETGIGGMLLHYPLGGPASHHGCTPDNPWSALKQGLNLSDTLDSGTGEDRVAGFQKELTLAPGQTGWFGVVTAFDSLGNQAALTGDVAAAYGTLGAQSVLEQALLEWEGWRKAEPAGLNPAEKWIYRQSESLLRQAQVRETTDLSFGQIVASLPPGNWNICWMRDMAYAIVALTRIGHHEEARAALAFVLKADSGHYQNGYVGVPYQVTITRYFGRGKEETDVNTDGPNIEFDGFGLFLWALGRYVAESGDITFLSQYWETIRDRVAQALLGLVDPNSGLIKADSSIWEVHWNGHQKQYTYTTLAAARGLCEAAGLARKLGHQALADQYATAGLALRNALVEKNTDSAHILASSREELLSHSGYHDMASVEAFNWRLLNPRGAIAGATMDAYKSHLTVASGLGFFRNDDGGWYDSQEWVFVDLRASIGFRMAARTDDADRLLNWITAQALNNHGMIAELHHPVNGDYEGEVPMAGFGAGAYILALLERIQPTPLEPACGNWETP